MSYDVMWTRLKRELTDSIKNEDVVIKKAVKEKDYSVANDLRIERTSLEYVLHTLIPNIEKDYYGK